MKTAKARWTELHAKRSGLITRCERYAQLSIPSICTKDGYDEGSQESTLDYQSLGAQCVNNLTNKMMLALFAPSRPFIRLDLSEQVLGQLSQALGMSPALIKEQTAIIEKEAVKGLDEIGARPVLYELLSHLIVTGNVARYMEGDVMRLYGIKNYAVVRNARGQVTEIITQEKTTKEDVEQDVHKYIRGDKDFVYYRWWKWDGKVFRESQWVEDVQVLEDKYVGQYKREDMPIQAHAWRLPTGRNYGVGLMEDYAADFEGVSMLAEAEVNGAILASEFRWLINPGGMTRPEDFQRTRNGASIPGVDGDVSLVTAGDAASGIQIVSTIADRYIRRVGAGFLLTSALQRDAERVTAEEIRMLANELETGLGGVYSRQAIDIQLPLGRWLLERVDSEVLASNDFKPTIVTGLDALSRNGDLENLQLYLGDVLPFTTLPPEIAVYFKLDNIFSKFATGRGIASSEVVRTQSEVDEINNANAEAEQERQSQLIAQQAALKGNQQ